MTHAPAWSGRSLAFVGMAVMALALPAPAARAGDWPQILGPQRNGQAADDERLADAWPAEGPPLLWTRAVGSGYAGAAIAEGLVVIFHRLKAAEADAASDIETVEALDLASGTPRWKDGHPTRFRPQVGSGDGPLCVPVIHEGRVVTYGAQGVLSCHALADGRLVWRRETHRDHDAREGYFGAGSTPLVVGRGPQAVVIVNVGGTRGETGIVAYGLEDGTPRWNATEEPASYASPVAVPTGPAAANADGDLPDVVVITRYRCLLMAAADGAIRWDVPFGMRGPTVNAACPLVMPDATGGGSLLITASYGIGSRCGPLTADGFEPRWEAVDSLASQYATPVLVGSHLYGFDGRDDLPPASLVCLDPLTGRVLWRERQEAYGTVLAADGKLLALGTRGRLQLIRPDPAGLRVLATARPLEGTVRGLPALSQGRLVIRDDDTLVCLNLAP